MGPGLSTDLNRVPVEIHVFHDQVAVRGDQGAVEFQFARHVRLAVVRIEHHHDAVAGGDVGFDLGHHVLINRRPEEIANAWMLRLAQIRFDVDSDDAAGAQEVTHMGQKRAAAARARFHDDGGPQLVQDFLVHPEVERSFSVGTPIQYVLRQVRSLCV